MIQWKVNQSKPDIHIRKAALAKFMLRFPERLEIRLQLIDQHLYLSEYEKAWNLLIEVQGEFGSNPDWLFQHGKIALSLGYDDIAKDSLTAAWHTGLRPAGILLAKLHNDIGQYDKAIIYSKAIMERDPSNYAANIAFCKSLIATNQLDELSTWAQADMKHLPYRPITPSALAYVSTYNTDRSIINKLVEPTENLFCKRNFTGGSSETNISEILLKHKARSDFPSIYAGKGEGKRIDGLLELGIDKVNCLFDLIKDAVEQYAVLNRSNPFIANIPKSASIESWANICTGNGHEDWHCHPGGWISGVYYLNVPNINDTAENEKLGEIEFGSLMLGENNDLTAWPKTQIKPENDMLLLFPSYFGHRTYPTRLRDPRISIAFDIVPTKPV